MTPLTAPAKQPFVEHDVEFWRKGLKDGCSKLEHWQIDRLCDAALLGLKAAEPVAWRYQGPTDEWRFTDRPPTKQNAHLLEPLYAAPHRANPYEQIAAGNHSIGVFKDGKLIAADAEVYAEPHHTGQEEFADLLRFYSVETLAELVLAQARHVERLQAKLPPMRDEFPRTPREG